MYLPNGYSSEEQLNCECVAKAMRVAVRYGTGSARERLKRPWKGATLDAAAVKSAAVVFHYERLAVRKPAPIS